MVKSTFINLPEKKKTLIMQVLLNEFSNYPLQKAQVSRIVKEAGIARGAFYKYFNDLTDAYQCLYKSALQEIHTSVEPTAVFDPQRFYQNVVNFVEHTLCSKYAKLVKMHVLYNESLVQQFFPKDILIELNSQEWSAMILSHGAIREILEDSSRKDTVLAHLKAGLVMLKKGSN